MGAGYSANLLKVKLKMATQRITLSISKKTNQIKVDRKNVGELLAKKKDESARIRVEAMIHAQNLISVMEIVSLMCELLQTRLGLITQSLECPDDLVEAMATIIFCANRVEIPELLEIAQQLAHKFKKEWAMVHLNNDSGRVNPKIVAKLSVKPPAFALVLAYLKEIAAYYQLDWEPNLEEPKKEDEDDINRLGSIARIELDPASGAVISGGASGGAHGSGVDPDIDALEAMAPPPGASSDSKRGASEETKRGGGFDPSIGAPPAHIGTGGVADLFPGTLNVIVHKARELYDAKHGAKQDPFVKLGIRGQPPTLKTSADHAGGTAPKWAQEHFPFGVKDPSAQLTIEAYNQGAITDDFLGGTVLAVSDIIRRPGPEWYPLGRDAGGKRKPAGALLLSIQYLPLSASTTIVLPPGQSGPVGSPMASSAPTPTVPQPPQGVMDASGHYYPPGYGPSPGGGGNGNGNNGGAPPGYGNGGGYGASVIGPANGGYAPTPGYPMAPGGQGSGVPIQQGGGGGGGYAVSQSVLHGQSATPMAQSGSIMGVSSGSIARSQPPDYGHNDDGSDASYQAMMDDGPGNGASGMGKPSRRGAPAADRPALSAIAAQHYAEEHDELEGGPPGRTINHNKSAAPIPSPINNVPQYNPDDVGDDDEGAPPPFPSGNAGGGGGVSVASAAAAAANKRAAGGGAGRSPVAGSRGSGIAGSRSATDPSLQARLDQPLLKQAAAPFKPEEQPDLLFPMREFGDQLKAKAAAKAAAEKKAAPAAAPAASSSSFSGIMNSDDDLEARFRALND